MRTISTASALVGAALLLAACASSDVGDIFPNGQVGQVQGVVRSVDTSGDCIIQLENARSSNYHLNDQGYGYGNGGGNTTIFCDRNTRVVFQGNTFRPEDLERGDEIVADVSNVGGRPVADRIDVTYDVSSNDRSGNGGRYGNNGGYGRNGGYGSGNDNGRYGGPYGDNDRYGNHDRYGNNDRYGNSTDPTGGNHDLRGTVRLVDAQNRTVTLEQVDYYTHSFDRNQQGDLLTLYFDAQTQVLFRGESYRPENLEAGDVIAVRVEDVRGTLIADQIDVVSDARGNAASYPQR
jgi:hypothetical protein